ncbi:MAG: hypothetical protein KJZ83_20690 [Burkholderiaceae bacterium]|nr:hypothetical protein [Burkholderiaceae bacterium]
MNVIVFDRSSGESFPSISLRHPGSFSSGTSGVVIKLRIENPEGGERLEVELKLDERRFETELWAYIEGEDARDVAAALDSEVQRTLDQHETLNRYFHLGYQFEIASVLSILAFLVFSVAFLIRLKMQGTEAEFPSFMVLGVLSILVTLYIAYLIGGRVWRYTEFQGSAMRRRHGIARWVLSGVVVTVALGVLANWLSTRFLPVG